MDGARPQLASLSSAYAETVVAINVVPLTVPLGRPVRNGTMTIADRDYIAVSVTANTGQRGTSIVFTRGTPVREVILGLIAPRLIGTELRDIAEVLERLARASESQFGRSGVFPKAMSVVDMAVWDLLGGIRDQSLTAMVGNSRQVPILMALGYYREQNEIDTLRDEYAQLVRAGFRQFKIMAGGATPARDLERIAAVTDVLPSDATLAVDVNGVWNNASQALGFIDSLPIELSFIEDPFRPDDLGSLRLFRASTPTPVAMGEWESGASRFRQLLDEDLVDVVRTDVSTVGGIDEWLAVAELAALNGKRVLPHYYPEVHVHLATATNNVVAIEAVPSLTGADNFGELVVESSWAVGASTIASDRPGFGVEWDWAAIRKYSTSCEGEVSAL